MTKTREELQREYLARLNGSNGSGYGELALCLAELAERQQPGGETEVEPSTEGVGVGYWWLGARVMEVWKRVRSATALGPLITRDVLECERVMCGVPPAQPAPADGEAVMAGYVGERLSAGLRACEPKTCDWVAYSIGLVELARQDQAARVEQETRELQSRYEIVVKNYDIEKRQRQALEEQRTEAASRIAALEAEVAEAQQNYRRVVDDHSVANRKLELSERKLDEAYRQLDLTEKERDAKEDALRRVWEATGETRRDVSLVSVVEALRAAVKK